MARGYWVVCYKSTTNMAALAEYRELAGTALQALGGRVLVAAEPTTTREAGVKELTVVIEFASLEQAIAAYESDLYKPALKVLDKAALRDFRIVEGR